MKKSIILLIVTLVCCVAVYTYINLGKHGKNIDQLRVGLSADYPPFETIKDGQIVGLDVDLIKAIGSELGLEVEVKDMPFYSLIASLESGKLDVAISAISATPERRAKIAFSDTYYTPQLSIIYLIDSPVSDVQNLDGMKLGAQTGTIMEMWAKKAAANGSDIQVMPMDSNSILLEELKNKHLNAVVIEALQAKEFCKRDPNLSYVEVEESSFGYSIAFAKGSPLVAKVNHALQELKKKGVLEEIEQKWIS